MKVYRAALNTYQQTRSLDEAERTLIYGWNEEARLHSAILPLQMLGAGDEWLRGIAKARWSLVSRALAHHQNGAYEASVPIVLAQIDGIVKDFADPKVTFFDREKWQEHFREDDTLLALTETLGPLRRLFSENMRQSGVEGKLSRHGILHGRELGYDTLANSTKVFVLLAAIVEWGLPRANRKFEEEQQEREQRYAGSDELDSSGRRMDRRGFAEAKNQLGIVDMLQSAHWNTHGYYTIDMSRLAPSSSVSVQLINATEIELRTNQGRTTYWAWTATPSGYKFGTAGNSDTRGVWHYAGKEDPAGGPEEDSRWRHVITDPAHPDW